MSSPALFRVRKSWDFNVIVGDDVFRLVSGDVLIVLGTREVSEGNIRFNVKDILTRHGKAAFWAEALDDLLEPVP